MSYKFSLDKMKEVYGEEIVEVISYNMDIIEKNIDLLRQLKFDDIDGLFERCPTIFMYFPKDFKEKIEVLIKQIGPNYVEVIQRDISILEDLL